MKVQITDPEVCSIFRPPTAFSGEKKQKKQIFFPKNSYKNGEKINAKVIKKQKVMERKRLKQQKMSFVNSIFNSSVSKLAK